MTRSRVSKQNYSHAELTNVPNQGRRNIIINGAMQISQRIGTTATNVSGGHCGIDRWGMYASGNGYTTQQVTDAPAGFYNSMKLASISTTTPVYSFFGQRIEGNNVNHIGLGTANCQSFTVSFYVKSSVAGVYSICMNNGAGNLSYPVQYTINSTNTWERKSMTIPPITSGTWEKGISIGLYLRFNLGSPSSRTAAADGWRSGNFDGADGSTGAVTWATTNGATFYMTGCQIEAGTEVTDFEHRSFTEELALCQRYFFSLNYPDGTRNHWLYPIDQSNTAAGYRRSTMMLPTSMRTTPTVTISMQGNFGSSGVDGGVWTGASSVSVYVNSINSGSDYAYMHTVEAESEL